MTELFRVSKNLSSMHILEDPTVNMKILIGVRCSKPVTSFPVMALPKLVANVSHKDL